MILLEWELASVWGIFETDFCRISYEKWRKVVHAERK